MSREFPKLAIGEKILLNEFESRRDQILEDAEFYGLEEEEESGREHSYIKLFTFPTKPSESLRQE